MNLAGILANAARFFPARPAVLAAGREITYAELAQEAGLAAAAAAARGVAPGDLAAICLPNGPAWLAAYFGLQGAGGAAVTLAYTLTGEELAQVLDDCRPGLLITTAEKLALLGDRADRPYLHTVVAPGGDLDWEGFLALAGGTPLAPVERERGDLAAVLYTGGTTGRSKGVMLSHQNLLASAHNVARQERSTEDDRVLCFLPLNHVFGQVHVMLSTILTAGSLDLLPGFDLEQVLAALEHGGVTKFYAVPTIYVRLLAQPGIGGRLGRVRYTFSAAASMARELVREWKEATGLDIHEAYGMTESAAMVSYNHYYRHKVGSVGTPVGTVEVAILDPAGHRLVPGQEGEICIQGPNIMQGYLNQPEETRRAFHGPWFRSGDVGYLDDEGYLFIVDRIKDMIITGGENVYPREIEELLYTLPEVEECAVVGLPDREYGERVTAAIKLKPGASLTPESLKAFLKEHLTSFKVPKAFYLVDELPKSATGKILKRNLRQELAG
ncbi:MAG: AMP-binding protein [Deltaproteobacteria bacterium]|nr:AMP-binding protein [Deltaproteobacteria bacterium]